MAIDQANEASIGGREFLVWRRPIENNGNELYVLEEVSQIHDLRRVIDQLEMESTDLKLNDQMTKLPNRDSLEQYLKALGKTDRPAYLLCFRSELSEHYALNLSADEFSIAQIRYAKAMQDELDSDFVAKLSRHMFAAVVESAQYDQIVRKVNKILKVNSSLTEELSAKLSKLSKFSCALIPKTKFDAGYLIDQTERLLFVSSLKHPIVQYQPTQSEKMFQEILLRSDMEQAIFDGEFSFVLQPKAKADGTLVEFEVLIRWKRLNEFIPPDIFIPIAESHGLVSQLTDWLLNQVCDYLSGQSVQQKKYPISINISAMDLIRNDFVERILSTLTEHAVSPSMLGIELTETAFPANLDLAVSQLKKLSFGACVYRLMTSVQVIHH